jgi:RHH-type proline utilization regulon transcriptional repressor/proline dehydrogenase/delta 1-pyrroline-5-carboxylate dehydrogenase
MELERVEAAIAGWPQAPYLTKQETDANYKRMLKLLIEGAAAGSVRVGVASHNLFDVALAILWTQDAGVGDKVQFEMLEGMANHQRRAITEHGESMVLYAPACSRDEFLNAIGYLIRRLDENTGPDNFLRHAYQLSPGSPKFQKLAHDFSESLRRCSTVSAATRRTQDRRQPPSQPAQPATWNELVNEPDTDWSLPYHVTWIQEILNDWQTRCNESATRIDTSTSPTKDWRESFDPSRPDVVSCRYVAIPLNQVHEAVERAKLSAKQWGQRPLSQRHAILREAAQQLRRRRGDLIAAMVADGGKVVSEADPEVSEAIDFCEFYPLTMRAWSEHPSITTRPRGVVGVITPWNFPLAIPCGGIAASLAAGNSVLLKPASETVMPAYVLCQAFWDAGVPHEVLQLVPCDDRVAEHGLVRNDSVDAVILTGATSTAQKMLAARPGLYLLAETGGKNATIVTAMADRDLAIKHVIQSAFGHAGQKCSATSLLLLEDEVFKDPRFRHTLADAVQSLRCGSAWDLATRMGPLIGEPNETLMRGMQLLEDDESWLVEPEHVIGNPNLFKPGVKWNVRPGSFSHMTELFGPVLSVMRFSRLEEAIEIVRGTGYGLTSGLESLDGREIELWQRTIHAGNLYVNRSTTGAIVLRQPFGGVGLSAYGPGVKAGGPHYVLALSRVHDAYSDASSVDDRDDSQEPQVAGVVREDEATWLLSWLLEQFTREKLSQTDYQQLSQAIASQLDACREEFDCSHDTFRLLGQDNYRRYKAVHGLTIRCTRHSARLEIFTALAATILVGTRATVSMDDDVAMELQQQIESLADEIPGAIDPLQESTDELISRMTQGHVRRLRVIGPAASLSPELLETSGQQFVTIVSEPVLREGRIECLRYLDEQSLCHDYHRYGNLGRRTSEVRRPVM